MVARILDSMVAYCPNGRPDSINSMVFALFLYTVDIGAKVAASPLLGHMQELLPDLLPTLLLGLLPRDSCQNSSQDCCQHCCQASTDRELFQGLLLQLYCCEAICKNHCQICRITFARDSSQNSSSGLLPTLLPGHL